MTVIERDSHFSAVVRLCRGVAGCNKGIAALEFGYVVPIMLMMFLGTVEFSQAITVDRRVSQVASSTADLVGRQETVTDTVLNGYMEIIDQLMKPYDDDLLNLTLSSVYATVDAPTQPKVCWSYNRNDAGTVRGVTSYSTGQPYSLPTGLIDGGASVIVVEVRYDYEPLIFQYFIKTSLQMNEKFYLKPRLKPEVKKDGSGCL